MIVINCRNGLSSNTLVNEILSVCFSSKELDSIAFTDDCATANIVVSYPYGNDFARPEHAVTVAYICESLRIDRPLADFYFCVSEKYHNLPKSCRIQWHGLSPNDFTPPADLKTAPEKYLNRKFCNFVYRNCVGYRETLFDFLSRYKHVDAPSRSRNNMEPFDDVTAMPTSTMWEAKRRFLSSYKFTIAAENDVFPGYETEKLYDALKAHSVPIYIGNPYVAAVFNADSFIAAGIPTDLPYWIERIEDHSQLRLSECRIPVAKRGVLLRLRVKTRVMARDFKNKWYLEKIAASLVETVIEVDKNPDLYLKMLGAPKVRKEAAQAALSMQRDLWIEIIRTAENLRSVK